MAEQDTTDANASAPRNLQNLASVAATRVGNRTDAHHILRAMKSCGGGMKLCAQVMNDELEDDMIILVYVMQVLWDFYTYIVKEVDTPFAGYRWEMRMSVGGWGVEIRKMIAVVEHNPRKLDQRWPTS